jgi:hypothetical protein
MTRDNINTNPEGKNRIFLSQTPIKFPYSIVSEFPIRDTRLAHPVIPDLISPSVFDNKYK